MYETAGAVAAADGEAEVARAGEGLNPRVSTSPTVGPARGVTGSRGPSSVSCGTPSRAGGRLTVKELPQRPGCPQRQATFAQPCCDCGWLAAAGRVNGSHVVLFVKWKLTLDEYLHKYICIQKLSIPSSAYGGVRVTSVLKITPCVPLQSDLSSTNCDRPHNCSQVLVSGGRCFLFLLSHTSTKASSFSCCCCKHVLNDCYKNIPFFFWWSNCQWWVRTVSDEWDTLWKVSQ